MKKAILITLLYLYTNFCFAQQPINYYNNGWNILGYKLDPATNLPGMIDHYKFYFYGDTLINLLDYKKLYYDFTRHNFSIGLYIPPDSFHYVGSMRNDGLLYYFQPKDSTGERLIYNFNLTVGDTAPMGYFYNQNLYKILHSTNQVSLLDNSYRNRHLYFFYDSTGYAGSGSYIDGIGDGKGLIDQNLYAVFTYDGWTDLYSYCENGTMLFKDSGFNFNPANTCSFPVSNDEIKFNYLTLIYPNPFKNLLNIATNETEICKVTIFDISSRKLLQEEFKNAISLNTENLASGLYIYEIIGKNGKIKIGKVVKQ